MTNPSSIRQPVAAGALGGIVRLIRQICLLREQGGLAQANRLNEEHLAPALAGFRAAHGPDALPESELQAIFATEESRVADAVILSELLGSQLVLRLPAASRPVSAGAQPAPEAPPAAERRPERGAPAIPDLLDAMLAAERAGPRTRR